MFSSLKAIFRTNNRHTIKTNIECQANVELIIVKQTDVVLTNIECQANVERIIVKQTDVVPTNIESQANVEYQSNKHRMSS